MTHKVIQIALAGHENTSSTQCNLTLVALCDDGTMWTSYNDKTLCGTSGERNPWMQVIPIPGTETTMVVDGWRPILEAPTDGRWVELYNCNSRATDTGQWDHGEWNQKEGNGAMTHWRPMQ